MGGVIKEKVYEQNPMERIILKYTSLYKEGK